MKRIFVLLVLLIVLTGCTPKVAGWVTERHFEPRHMEQYLRTETYPCGSYTRYNGTTPTTTTRYCTRSVPDWRTIPDKWYLYVTDDAGKTHTIQVKREVHDQYTVNTRWDNTK